MFILNEETNTFEPYKPGVKAQDCPGTADDSKCVQQKTATAGETKADDPETERLRKLREMLSAPPDADSVFKLPVQALLLHTEAVGKATAPCIERIFLRSDNNPLQLYKALDNADAKAYSRIFISILDAQLTESMFLGQIMTSNLLSAINGNDIDEVKMTMDMKLRLSSETRAIIAAHRKLRSVPVNPRPPVLISVNTAGVQNVAVKSGGEPPVADTDFGPSQTKDPKLAP